MWSRADLEKFYRGFFWVIVVLVSLILAVTVAQSSAKADEPGNPTSVTGIFYSSIPVICMPDRNKVHQLAEKLGFFILWQGTLVKEYLTSVYVKADGTWQILYIRDNNPMVCVLSFGDESDMTGREASN